MPIEILVRQGDTVVTDTTSANRYQIASISKQFTAVSVLLLAQRGALSVDDPLDRWIDGWPGVTVHHLLTHTSGIGHWPDYPMIDLSERLTPSAVLDTFRSVPPVSAPGGAWRYSSPGYVLLANVVERAAGTPYRELLADRVLGPLGMARTFAGMPAGRPAVATGHDREGRPAPSWELDVLGMGTGDVWSTAHDMMTWLDALEDGRLLDEPYREMMLTAHAGGYGYGVFVGETGVRRYWRHDGFNAGFVSYVANIPEIRRRVVLLADTENVPPAAAQELLG